MAKPPPPPPRHAPVSSSPGYTPSLSRSSTPEKPGWKGKLMATGKKAMDKGQVYSDKLGGKVNDIAEKKFHTEAFWPVTGDFPKEMEKAARILRSFTVDGVLQEQKNTKNGKAAKTDKLEKKIRVLRKIPPHVFQNAKGVAIFTSFRSGIAPLGGAGGTGLVVAKLPDGSWSPPAAITPQNLSTGLMFGLDVYDCILILRTDKAVDSFKGHKATIGVETAVAVGPYGGGAAIEAGKEKAPVLSYIKSKGGYAGVEVVGQVYFERYDENGKMYHYPGVKPAEILSGKVKMPREAENLIAALEAAESGRAQREKGTDLDIVVVDGQTPVGSGAATPVGSGDPNEAMAAVQLESGETLKLPPRPEMTDGTEFQSDSETERVHYEHSHLSHEIESDPFGDEDQPGQTADLGNGLVPPPSYTASGTAASRGPPPPPPPRRRPPPVQAHSSTSHYSNAEEELSPTIDQVRGTTEKFDQLDVKDGEESLR